MKSATSVGAVLGHAILVATEIGSTFIYGLVHSTESDGFLSLNVWRVRDFGEVSLIASHRTNAKPVAGLPAQITHVSAETLGLKSDLLLVTGLDGLPIWSLAIDGSGSIQDHDVIYSEPHPADANQIVFGVVEGKTFAYVSHLGSERPTAYEVLDDGTWQISNDVNHSAAKNGIETVTAVGVAAVTAQQAGGCPFLVIALEGKDILVTLRTNSDGSMSDYARVEIADGWGISNPSGIELVFLSGEIFAIVAATGSSSLSIVHIDGVGQMTLIDHVIDDLSFRFQGVKTLSVLAVEDTAYIVVAGADQGFSVFQLLPDGTLVHLATAADEVGQIADDLNNILLQLNGDKLEIFTFSGSEGGVGLYSMDIGEAGETIFSEPQLDAGEVLEGGTANDKIFGGDGHDTLIGNYGDDILRDGGGEDALYGGHGADLFVLSYDGVLDEIRDFELGVDGIDLSHWPYLRSVFQLQTTSTSNGAEIVFDSEVLKIFTSNGSSLSATQIGTLDLIQFSRSLPSWTDESFEAADPGTNLFEFYGTSKKDTFLGGDGEDTIYGLGADDTLLGGGAHDTISGGEGNDSILGEGGADMIFGGWGDDVIDGGVDADQIWGDAGNDHLKGFQAGDTINGGSGDDTLFGQSGADTLQGESGDDRLDGGINFDQLYGGSGNDILYGKNGFDTLQGGAGTDTLYGNSGNDSLFGDSGADTLNGGLGFDVLYGGDGDDLLSGVNGFDELFGAKGDDQLFGNAGNDMLFGGRGEDDLSGGIGRDTLDGGENRDVLSGNSGHDVLDGGAGDDTLWGNAGNDTLKGGDGNDVLNGGIGADQFEFSAGKDTIQDFSIAVDQLVFSANLWGDAEVSVADAMTRATIENGNIVFEFGDDQLRLSNVTNLHVLTDLIFIE